jgi:FkbM family methyltransferase
MKILWASNACHVASGYGIQTNHVIEGLQQFGHEIALAPNYGIAGGALDMGGMRVYPPWRDKVGKDVLAAHAKHFGADLLISLYDLWPFDSHFASRLPCRWAAWFPQDSDPPVADVVARAREADYPIAMSKFGVESMRKAGVDCHYIPHGCAVDVYKPMDKAACRKELSLPEDKFIVLMVAANQSYPSRKAFPECLMAFKAFHDKHPDSLLHLYTTCKPRYFSGDGITGIELDILIHALGLDDCVTFANEYGIILGLPDTEMAKIYNSADVLLSTSMGEGFGVPIIEAQACGLPVVTTAFSAMTELTINGIAVDAYQKMWIQGGNTWQATPSIQGVADALETIYSRTAEETRQASTVGRQAIVQDYSWPVIMDHWREFLAHVEKGEKPSQERLYHCAINGIEFDAYDDRLSFTVPCVESELKADAYHFEGVTVEPGDVILDIGAHVGGFSIYAAKRWPQARILAFEPSTTNYQRLLRNLELAGVKNVEPFNLAVTSDGRDINLSLDRNNTGGTSALRKANGHLVEPAKSTTLDAIVSGLGKFIGDYPRVRFLKIDAEGCEHEILTTATCLDMVDYLGGEFHINSYLQKQGYSIAGLAEHCKGILGPQRVTFTSCQMDE